MADDIGDCPVGIRPSSPGPAWRPVLALLGAGALLGVLLPAPRSADASPRSVAHRGSGTLVPGAGAGDPAPEGTWDWDQQVGRRRWERLDLRIGGLEPRTTYDVRDRTYGVLLTQVRARRSGKARVRLFGERHETDFTGRTVAICAEGAEDPILRVLLPGYEGAVPDEGMTGVYYTAAIHGSNRSNVDLSVYFDSLRSVADGSRLDSLSAVVDGDSVVAPVTLWIEDSGGVMVQVGEFDPGFYDYDDDFEWSAGYGESNPLPLDAADLEDLQGRAIAIRDGTGEDLRTSTVPEVLGGLSGYRMPEPE